MRTCSVFWNMTEIHRRELSSTHRVSVAYCVGGETFQHCLTIILLVCVERYHLCNLVLITCEDQRNDRKKKSVKLRKPAETESEAAREIRVDLQGSDLWKRFHEIGTEMIITKVGRQMAIQAYYSCSKINDNLVWQQINTLQRLQLLLQQMSL